MRPPTLLPTGDEIQRPRRSRPIRVLFGILHSVTSSDLAQYRVADFLAWHRSGQLSLNPYFQRRSVWTQPARVYLIDTMLRRLSMPKFYLRTTIDLRSQQAVREVVDGQQRLRAILEFADDKFALTSRAGDLAGLRYSTLDEDQQERFLSYTLSVEQLLNATDSDVLEVFARLNSYTTTLNPAERRHAEFQGPFKWAVHEAARRWTLLWEEYQIVSVRERLRMSDDATIAELLGVLADGVKDGGEPYVTALYKRLDTREEAEVDALVNQLENVLPQMLAMLGPAIRDTPLVRRPQFLMLFAAFAHQKVGLQQGDLGSLPERSALLPGDQAAANLRVLASSLEAGDADALGPLLRRFRVASASSTQRIGSRQVRFEAFTRALLGRRESDGT